MAEYKDIELLKKQIADFKRAVKSENSDYLTGYISALSTVEGMIAEQSTADTVEVVRCKDCKHLFQDLSERKVHLCMRKIFREKVNLDDFCSYGEKGE